MHPKSQIVLEVLARFEQIAIDATQAFIEQNKLTVPPLIARTTGKIPPSGVLLLQQQEVRYQFHGNGCQLTFPNHDVVDFNYAEPDWIDNSGASFYALWEFLKNQNVEFEDIDLLETCINDLIHAGKVYKPNPNYEKYKIKTQP